jgi:integrase
VWHERHSCRASDALVDERIESNPCVLHRGELPAKVDEDPEWRSSATYTTREVEQLISDPRIPVERRMQYALKAIAGLRHGEVAGLHWRHHDPTLEGRCGERLHTRAVAGAQRRGRHVAGRGPT